jgi:NAD(P)-dependent dehydrogenase (short-subunit alcohol dehydrogenase family)
MNTAHMVLTVTGVGIGKHTALSFAKYGIQRLALADMNSKDLQNSIKSLREQYPDIEVLPLQMNVRSSAEVKSGIAETIKKFGRLDVAVNNAGIGGSGAPTHEVEEEEWQRVLDVDLNGVWRCQKEELAVMMKQEDRGSREGRGRIVNVASMYGIIAPGSHMSHTAYAAAKHGECSPMARVCDFQCFG